jgi:hypothetical protein
MQLALTFRVSLFDERPSACCRLASIKWLARFGFRDSRARTLRAHRRFIVTTARSTASGTLREPRRRSARTLARSAAWAALRRATRTKLLRCSAWPHALRRAGAALSRTRRGPRPYRISAWRCGAGWPRRTRRGCGRTRRCRSARCGTGCRRSQRYSGSWPGCWWCRSRSCSRRWRGWRAGRRSGPCRRWSSARWMRGRTCCQ